jgi:hypothetical protein
MNRVDFVYGARQNRCSKSIWHMVVVAVACVLGTLYADESTESRRSTAAWPLTIDAAKAFKPIVALEAWATYSMDETKGAVETAHRADVSFRRLRIGASGKPLEWLSYTAFIEPCLTFDG